MPGQQDGPAPKPRGHELPQIVCTGTVRRSLKSCLVTFRLRLFRVVELTFLVPFPRDGSPRVPVYVRFWVDAAAGDRPGTVPLEPVDPGDPEPT